MSIWSSLRPPYNLGVGYRLCDDGIPYVDWLGFTEKWLTKCLKLARDDGRLCLNVPLDKNKGGQQSVCADVTTIAKQVVWKYHSTIIWNEQNISKRTAWGSWLSASAPYVIAPVEIIVVLYKKDWNKEQQWGIRYYEKGIHGMDQWGVEIQWRKQKESWASSPPSLSNCRGGV